MLVGTNLQAWSLKVTDRLDDSRHSVAPDKEIIHIRQVIVFCGQREVI